MRSNGPTTKFTQSIGLYQTPEREKKRMDKNFSRLYSKYRPVEIELNRKGIDEHKTSKLSLFLSY
jgi:hypothetical protein